MIRFTSVSVLVVLTALAADLMAQDAGEAFDEARTRFNRGVELFNQEEHEASLAEFERAFELAPNFAVLYNIGQVNVALDRFPQAIAVYQRYLDEGGEGVQPDRRAEVEQRLARLRALVGRVVLTVEQPAGAVVYVDGVEVGRTPLGEPLLVRAGNRIVEVRSGGYLPHRSEISVAGGAEVALQVRLYPVERPTGGIVVSVVLPGAIVLLDGVEVGTTPLEESLSAPPGRHEVRVTRPGYQEASVVVEVASRELVRAELEPSPLSELPSDLSGTIDVVASEPETILLLDGGPLPEGPIPVGPHLLEARHEGFEPWSGRVDVASGSSRRTEVTLVPTLEYRERYEDRANHFRLAAFITASAAVVLLGTALGLHLYNYYGSYQDWEDEDEALRNEYRAEGISPEVATELWQRTEEHNDAYGSWQALRYATWALLGVGLAAAGAAAGLFIAGPDPDRYARFSVGLQPGGVMAAVRWEIP